jgi:hypothetical protein
MQVNDQHRPAAAQTLERSLLELVTVLGFDRPLRPNDSDGALFFKRKHESTLCIRAATRGGSHYLFFRLRPA